VCEGVIAKIAPSARVIHLTHGIPPRSVDEGAAALAEALPYLPVGVHVAVVDPGVGSHRRPMVIRCGDGRLLVGPDNGLLLPAADRCGGADGAWEITDPALMLGEVSATFHGRDVFAPVAAHLAAGVAPDAVGPALDPGSLVRPEAPEVEVETGAVRTRVVHVDGFGNCALGATPEDLDRAGLARGSVLRVVVGGRPRGTALRARTFSDVPARELVVYDDSRGVAALAVNGADAAQALGCRPQDAVALLAGES
jgi:S-adenosyl-L-methionine hydrolase (adenosine-forming)